MAQPMEQVAAVEVAVVSSGSSGGSSGSSGGSSGSSGGSSGTGA